MQKIIETLLDSLKMKLDSISDSDAKVIEKSRQSLTAVQMAIIDLKDKCTPFDFPDREAEVNFFKNILPEFYSLLIYHLRVFNLEANRPIASQELYRKMLQRELKDIKRFFEKQAGFIKYYNSDSQFLDQEYFTRGRAQLPFMLIDYSIALDPNFCTTYSLVISQILAFEKLQTYLLNELKMLNQPIGTPSHLQVSVKSKKWLLGPFTLIELGYLIHLTGGVSGTLKSTMDFLEQVFDIKLGNYSRVLQEMRIRKEDRTIFLTKGRQMLYDHMDRLDDNIR
jgi:hypothetical protein